MTAEEYKKKVLSISRGYQMALEIEECALLAGKNDQFLPVLSELLLDAVNRHDWKSPICSRVIHILVATGSSSSLFFLLDFIKKLPDSVPFALVELLGNLLASYRKIIIGPAKELSEFPAGTPQRAVGIQTLCNLHLEDLLPPENIDYLAGLLERFEVDPFFTDYLVDLVRTSRSFRERKKEQSAEIPEDILVELGPGETNGV